MKQKRVNKTKEEIKAEMEKRANLEWQKAMARRIFRIVEKQDTIYDAQTVVNALAGYAMKDITAKLKAIKFSDLTIELTKEKDGKIKKAMEALIVEFKDETANDITNFFKKFGEVLDTYAAQEFKKQKMSKIKEDDFIA